MSPPMALRLPCWRHVDRRRLRSAVGVGLLLLAAPAVARADEALRAEAMASLGVLPAVEDARRTEPAAVLGRRLFWDPRVSSEGGTACASCHRAADGGADRRRFSPDARGRLTGRNSQTVFNAMLQPSLRWTGDRRSGAHQAERSLTGSMGFKAAEEVVPVLRELGYEADFRLAFPGETAPVSPANYAKALQAYQETLVTPAPFDRFLAGDDAALSAEAREGLRVFLRVGCADCHDGPLLGGGAIRRFGVTKDYWTATGSTARDAGLSEATGREADRYRFRVSMLRNIATTAPYFHDGSVADLREAVQVMADVQLGGRLPEPEAAAVTAFLASLTGEVPPHFGPP